MRRRLQLRRGLVRRLPPLAAGAADRRPRRLLRRFRTRPSSPRRSIARTSTTATTPLSPPAVRRPGRRRPGAQFVVYSQDHDQVGNRAFGDRMRPRRGRWPPSARCCRRLCRCCSWARSTASARRFSSSQTTSTRRSRSRRARAAGASSPRSHRSSESCPTRGPGDVRALQADAAARP